MQPPGSAFWLEWPLPTVTSTTASGRCSCAPAQINPTVPRLLSGVLLRALEKEPADRYPDAASFRLALLEAIASARQGAPRSARLSDWVRARLRRGGEQPG